MLALEIASAADGCVAKGGCAGCVCWADDEPVALAKVRTGP